MPKGTCTIAGCERPVYARVWCGPHYQRWKTYGDPTSGGSFQNPGAECSVDGCFAPSRARSLCSRHYMRLKATGTTADKACRTCGNPIAQKLTYCGTACKPRCTVTGCGRRRESAKYCKTHREQWKKRGAAGPIMDQRPRSPEGCEVAGCTRPVKAVGLCDAHYQHNRKYGGPTAEPTGWAVERRAATAEEDAIGVRMCTSCGAVKPLTEYLLRKSNRGGRVPVCNGCRRDRNRRNRAERIRRDPNGEKRKYRANYLREKYGITVAEYERRAIAQGGCAVCGSDEKLFVDHDHATGIVRDLLCNGCNCALGLANDDPARLRALADYIERHTEWSKRVEAGAPIALSR